MLISSDFTEETVETVYEEAPKKVPAKQVSFIQCVGQFMARGSSSDDSQQSAHMKPSPCKYYGQAQGYPITPDTEAEMVSSTSL
jgi:hypothetical protein